MIPIFLCLIVSVLGPNNAKAESISPRVSIHQDLSLKKLTPTYQKAPKFRLGFRTLTLEDPWHDNVMAFDYKPVPKNRRLLANIWYPASTHKNSMIHSNYYEVDLATDPYAKVYLEHTRRFRRLLQFQESVAQTGFAANTPIFESNKIEDPQAFQRAVPALRDAPFAEGRFPVVFYHSGAQGSFDENAPLFEYLATQGIVVVSVIGPPEEGGFDASQRSVELLWDDVNVTLAELQRDSHIDPTRIAFLGFSIGAQHAMTFALNNRRFAAVVLLDTTYENQDFKDIPIESKERLEERGPSIRTPFLILSGIAANFGKNDRFRFYQPLKSSPALFVDFGKDVNHDDFTWHGLVNRASHKDLDRKIFDNAMQRYQRVGDLTLDFLTEAFRSEPDWSRLPSIARSHLSDETFHRSQAGIPWESPDSKIVEILAGDSKKIEGNFKITLANKSVSAAHLNTLIKQVRYTYSSDKALAICKALPLAEIDNPVNCIAIALESRDADSAKKFTEYFFNTRKKPGKKDHFFRKIEYSDAQQLKEMMEKERFKAREVQQDKMLSPKD